MNLILYQNSSDNNTLDKSLIEITNITNVLLLDDTNILNPVFRLKINSELTGINYCYCAEFKRYYYITNITIENGGIYRIDCAVDVLMTYKNEILNTNAIITRAGTDYNVLIGDSAKIAQSNTNVVNKFFSGGELLDTINATNHSFLLTCYGGIL